MRPDPNHPTSVLALRGPSLVTRPDVTATQVVVIVQAIRDDGTVTYSLIPQADATAESATLVVLDMAGWLQNGARS